MAVSGSKDFELNVAEYIEEAFERCGLELRTGYDAKTARRSLNLLFADWANRGLNRWTISQVTQTVAEEISEYPVGTITLSVSDSGSFTIAETITGGTSAATASLITKPDSTSMTITVPSGTFTSGETITGSSSSATTTTTSTASLEDTQSTIDILSGVIRRDSSDIAITRISRDDYLNIATKSTKGRPTQFYVDRLITPVVKVWPTPENSTDQFIYDRLVRIDDADASVNTVEIPFRFYPCLAAGLAYYIALKKAPERIQILKALYEEEFLRAAEEDRDKADLTLVPTYNSLSAIS
jgi:hypothetical protein|tara:strand:- start:5667 stop:6557 length:891 start_codon:yes stop_codon:yes gene_type:complete